MISLDRLHKRFGDRVAVDEVSFTARDGEVTGFLGPNGAGKTTTLRMIYSLIRPDGGRALVDGIDVIADPLGVRSRIGVLPDARGLYPRLTVREHVRYYGRLHGLWGAALEKRIDALAELLEIRELLDRRTEGFSQGERMKVAIARALVHGPRNVLLDEPTNGLDVMSTRAMRTVIRRLREQGTCVLFSSHVMQEVSALCDRLVVIARGRVVAEGSPAELLSTTGHASLEDAFVHLVGIEGPVEQEQTRALRRARGRCGVRLRTPLFAVLIKELVDHLRDRRSLMSALMFPIFGPIALAMMMNLIASWADKDQPVELAVVQAERAPTLIAFLERYGIAAKPAPEDYEAKVQDGTLDAVLVIPEDFGSRFGEGRPAPLQLVFDRSRRSAGTRVDRVQQILQAYSGYVANLRLLARGVSPELAMPLQLEEVDLATPEKLGAMLLNMIPIFLVLATFVGGMNLAIDVTAGERERGSLEPLLVNPAPTRAVVMGKWLATVVVAALSVGITLVGFFVALGRVPLATLGVKASMGVPEAAVILAAVLPLTLFASGVQMLVATYARSFKEAQTWLSLLLMIPMIPGMVMSFVPFDGNTLLRAVPVMGQHLMIDAVLRGEGVSPLEWALSLVGVALPAVVCLMASTRLLREERIIYGR